LLRDALGDQLRVGVGVTHLVDLEVDVFAGFLGEFLTDLVNVLALAPDHDARTGGEQVDAHAIGITLDQDLGDRCTLEAFLDHLADHHVFRQQLSELLLVGKPTATPLLVNRDSETDRIYFLSQSFAP